MSYMQDLKLSQPEINFLHKWLGKMVDRGDLLEEIQEDNEEPLANELFNYLKELV